MAVCNFQESSKLTAKAYQHLCNAALSTSHLAITIWTFAAADLRTMVLPLLLLGLLSASAGTVFTVSPIALVDIVKNVPGMFVWLWLNVLLISISNQRTPHAIIEDKINKPWRPIPSGRIDVLHARQLLLWAVAVLLLVSHRLGVLYETLGCLAGNWIYNDLEGGDEHFLLRQLLNGVAYLPYGIGSMKLAVGVIDGHNEPSAEFYRWITLIAAIVGTTIQVQDLKDCDGDRARNRHTFPVVLGERITRISVCVGVLFWSVLCPVYWNLAWHSCLLSGGLGVMVILSVSFLRGRQADKMSFVLWSFWLMSLFVLPSISQQSGWLVYSS
ncbi:hypothetical protein VTN77DRAFT_9788 [Rasamsonia byssochlamydoides]|uniref:uncharacterized protein n=1 Tax=Rasamsonia byssochlamydoides TaxID=89139 RepID=UPI00374257BB